MKKFFFILFLFFGFIYLPITQAQVNDRDINTLLLFVLGGMHSSEIYDEKEPYDSFLPTIKLQTDYQKLTTDIQGYRLGAELGWIAIGGDVDYTHYFEGTPANRYRIFSTHFLYRLAIVKQVQLNLGLGYKKFSGALQNEAFDMSFPLYIFPTQRWSIEIQPAFSFINQNKDAAVYDLQGGLRYKYKLVGIRTGYRWVRIQGLDFHGPQVGLVLEW